MSKDKFEIKIEGGSKKNNRHGHIWTGFFLVLAGGLLLMRSAGFPFPHWFFTWPVLLIAIGLFSGIRHGFKRGGWLIMMLVGGIFLVDKIDPTIAIRPYLIPMVLIIIGFSFILRPPRHRCERRYRQWQRRRMQREQFEATMTAERSDFVDITSVFGAVKKNVLTKNFKGGDIVCFMGGAEVNLGQADFTGRVKIDITNTFGGTMLIVPSNWDVQSEVVAIFGGVEDKRQLNGQAPDPDKVLVLDGTCLFGGIEIRNF